MTIENSIEYLTVIKKSYLGDLSENLSIAINTMRKYQKIREIAFPLQFCSTDKLEHEAIMKICEVLEDGSENNHHASNS